MDIFQLMGRIAVDNSSAITAMDETADKGESTRGRMVTAFQEIGSAVYKAFKGIVNYGAQLADSSAAALDTIDKSSQKMGLTRKGYQELDFVMSQSGASIETMQAGMKTLTSAMESGDDAFAKLGVSLLDSSGNMRSQEDVMWDTFAALQNMEDGAEKTALATKLFGRSGMELLPLLNSQAGSIEKLRQQAEEMGLVIGDDAVDAGVAYTDAMDVLNRQVQALKTSLGAKLLPMITKVINKVTPILAKIFPKLEKAFENVIKVIEPVAEWLSEGLGKAFDYLEEKFEGLFGEDGSINWDVLGSGISSMFKDLGAKIPDLLKVLGKAISAAWENGVWPMIQGLFKGVFGIDLPDWSEIKLKISEWWGKLQEKVDNICRAVFGISGGEAWEKVKGFFTTWWNNIKDNVTAIFTAVWKLANGELTWDDVKEIFVTWWNTIKHLVESVFSVAWKIGENNQTISDILTIFQAFWDTIKETVETIFSVVWGIASGEMTWEDVKDKFVNWWNKIKENVTKVFTAVFSLAGQAWEALKPKLELWWSGVKDNVESEMTAAFNLLPPDVQKVINDIIEWWKEVTSKITLTLTAGWGGVFGSPTPDYGDSPYHGAAGDAVDSDGNANPWMTGLPTFAPQANGLDFVPRDGVLASLHYGEAVLNRTDAKNYRDGSGNAGMLALADKMDAMIEVLQSSIGGSQQIVLDTGVLVGATVGMIDNQLGTMAGRKGRGN